MEAAARSSSQVRRAKRSSTTTAAEVDVLFLPAVGIGADARGASHIRRAKPPKRRTAQIPSRQAKPKTLRPQPLRPRSNHRHLPTVSRGHTQIQIQQPPPPPPRPNRVAKRARTDLPCPPDDNNNWRDWANIDDGPAGLIAERVLAYDVADYVRFRAVCRPWRQCSTEPRSHSSLDRRFHPWRWTMLREKLTAPDRRCFLNTSTGRCVQVNIPELRDHEVLALTPEGLLVLVHKPQCNLVRLLNPLTRHLTELPPLTTLLPPEDHDKLSQLDIHTYCPAWGSGIANDDSTFVLCLNRLDMLGLAKPGDDNWTLLEYNGYGMTTAPLMFKGRFYCFNANGVMVLENGTDQPPRLEVVAANRNMRVSRIGDSVHLVNNFGELMLVHRQGGYASGKNLGWQYGMYRVDLDTGTLSPARSLGGAGRAVFMGMYCSLSVSLDVFPSGSLSADTIYLSFDVNERRLLKVGAYHLSDSTTDPPYSLVPRPHTLVDCLSLSNATRGTIPFS